MSKNNSTVHHYVPQWYQHLFIPQSTQDKRYHRLDLNPEKIWIDKKRFFTHNSIKLLGPVSCFQEDDLYTLFFGKDADDILERNFFGDIDRRGSKAIQFFNNWEMASGSGQMLQDLVRYLDAQKMRTPKGLDFLKKTVGVELKRDLLFWMARLWQINCTIWMEGIWEILDCRDSPTHFIVSDNPLTTYNKSLFPLSSQCQYPFDAPIGMLGTHTIFPLGPTKLLVITNLGYVRNPDVNRLKERENPRQFAQTLFDLRKIQTGRALKEEDVIAINYILKSRSRKYIASSEKEWLFPEKYMPSSMWDKLGDKFFLMPDPRKVSFSTDTVVGYKDGSAWGMDEYGRRSTQNGKAAEALRRIEFRTFEKHKALWDSCFGKLDIHELRKYW